LSVIRVPDITSPIALALLDEQIGESDLLMSVAPIRLISIGGSLAVCVLGNRESSYDIDCVLDPNIAAAAEYADEFKRAVEKVATKGDLANLWLNRQLETFISRTKRANLFMESVQQGIPIYSGTNLTIYAGRLDWALERKLRRVAHAKDRRKQKDVDIPDAAALIRRMVSDSGRPLTFEYTSSLNYNGFDVPPTKGALQEVAQYYAGVYGDVGLVELVWDDDHQKNKYRGLDDQWVWYE